MLNFNNYLKYHPRGGLKTLINTEINEKEKLVIENELRSMIIPPAGRSGCLGLRREVEYLEGNPYNYTPPASGRVVSKSVLSERK